MVNDILFIRMDTQVFCASKKALSFVHWDAASGAPLGIITAAKPPYICMALRRGNVLLCVELKLYKVHLVGEVGGGGFQRKIDCFHPLGNLAISKVNVSGVQFRLSLNSSQCRAFHGA